MMQAEEAGGVGVARALVDGRRLTKAGAGLVNAETIFSGGKWDTFRMLTHPSCAILPAALSAAETEGLSGKEFITGLVAGYEVMERMAADFIPTVMARGFHAGPVFGIFGAAITLAKLTKLDAEQIPRRHRPMREPGQWQLGRRTQRWALTSRRRCGT